MWSQPTEPLARMPKSDLACHSCRKRKVKCDRDLPRCMACGQTGQTCNYPLHPMKPGPKIGSFQRQRKGRQIKKTGQNEPAGYPSSSPSNPGMNAYDGDFRTLDDVLETDKAPSKATNNTDAAAEADAAEQPRNQHLNMHDLSFILHPSHESSPPGGDQAQSVSSKEGGQASLCRQACKELGVSQTLMNQMIRVYLDNMVAISLFHEPSFPDKLLQIPSLSQISALLAAIAAYASRFLLLEANDPAGDELRLLGPGNRQPSYFVDLAFSHINKALAECDDEMPPLCVIQALIIATHCQLTRGVHGKAWRSLGLCVRLAYEINLHLLDSKTTVKVEDPFQWQADEEKRRAFWAIWEMDVFASTIRRTPTAIDWTQMEILLPVDNADWFQGRPAPSCFMEIDENQRWKALQDSNNQSPKAWFLVINSLMKGAQIISNPRGVARADSGGPCPPITHEVIKEARQKLEIVANAVRCFSLALPGQLQYRDQHLSFDPSVPSQFDSQRQQHCSIYNIFVMTQLARLMIYRYDAFRPQTRRSEIKRGQRSVDHPEQDRARSSHHNAESVALQHYFDAADNILRVVNQSCEKHIQHINPFLSSTIWLASAVQLVRKYFARTPAEKSLIKSRFNVLYFTYKRCVQFWDTQTALQQNLEALEMQLEASKSKPHSRATTPSWESSKRTLDDMDCQAERDAKRRQNLPHSSSKRDSVTDPRLQNNLPTQFLPGTPPPMPVEFPPLVQDKPEDFGMLDFMTLPQGDRTQSQGSYMMPTDGFFYDTTDPMNGRPGQCLDWRDFDFPSGIHDVLVGWSTY
ncbi:hypothetical protein BDV18DRAFT_155202 [Aspergillus unguis]